MATPLPNGIVQTMAAIMVVIKVNKASFSLAVHTNPHPPPHEWRKKERI